MPINREIPVPTAVFPADEGPVSPFTKTQFAATVHENLSIVVPTLASMKTAFEAITGEVRLMQDGLR